MKNKTIEIKKNLKLQDWKVYLNLPKGLHTYNKWH